MIVTEEIIDKIVRNVIKEAFDEGITDGSKFKVGTNNPKILAKIIARKYNVDYHDFRFDGVNLVYTPKTSEKRKKVSKPKDMSVETYYQRFVLPNNPKLQAEEDKYSDEVWKPIQNIGRYFKGAVDYSNVYEISNYGRLRIINIKDAMKSRIYTGYDAPTRGSMQAHLNMTDANGNSFKTTGFIGNMVADAFLEPHNPKFYKVRHKDGDYSNNKVDNLEWVLRRRHD